MTYIFPRPSPRIFTQAFAHSQSSSFIYRTRETRRHKPQGIGELEVRGLAAYAAHTVNPEGQAVIVASCLLFSCQHLKPEPAPRPFSAVGMTMQSQFCSLFFFYLMTFQDRVFCLTVLKLALWTRLILNSQKTACLCSPSAGVKQRHVPPPPGPVFQSQMYSNQCLSSQRTLTPPNGFTSSLSLLQ